MSHPPRSPELQTEIERLRTRLRELESGPVGSLSTVRVPPAITQVFLDAQVSVARYFEQRVEDPSRAMITISGERYILVRAASMSVEFYELVKSLYQDRGADEARSVASNLLFDVAHSLGKADAKAFHARMGHTDPIAKLSAGPVHFAHTGWAFVDIHPESRLSDGGDLNLVYDHPYSFEADAWLRSGKQANFHVCVMNAGYSSGWCEESFGVALVAAELTCQARGDERCRFVMAPPSRIEARIGEWLEHHPEDGACPDRRQATDQVAVPEYFQRKRLEEDLRQSNARLEQRVQERTHDLGLANERLVREIAEHQRAEVEVQRLNSELERRVEQRTAELGRANRELESFSYSVSHDLRAPLRAIDGYMSILVEDFSAALTPEAHKLLADIGRNARRMGTLIDDLLDFSRLSRHGLVLAPTPLGEVAAQVVEDLRASHPDHRATFEIGPLPTIVCDRALLRQVFANLLGNALKFTRQVEQPMIRVDCETRGGEHVIQVRDNGAGFDMRFAHKLFSVFERLHGADIFEGTGVGLAIVQRIVERHGGRVWAHSEPDRGATFWIALPASHLVSPA